MRKSGRTRVCALARAHVIGGQQRARNVQATVCLSNSVMPFGKSLLCGELFRRAQDPAEWGSREGFLFIFGLTLRILGVYGDPSVAQGRDWRLGAANPLHAQK